MNFGWRRIGAAPARRIVLPVFVLLLLYCVIITPAAAREYLDPRPKAEMQLLPEDTAAAAAGSDAFDPVPFYYQTDYPDTPYANSTIALSGCSITCLAMVATYLTGQEYLPDQLAYHFGGYGSTHVERMEHICRVMELPFEKKDDIRDVLQEMRKGKIAIAMVNQESRFTVDHHFVVFSQMTGDGRIRVHDPSWKDWTGDVYMMDRVANGFMPYDLSPGFCGAWLFDKAAMPEEPYLYPMELPTQQSDRYAHCHVTEADVQLLAEYVCSAAPRLPERTLQAVAEVVLNRVASEEYPDSVQEVLAQGGICKEVPGAVPVPPYPEHPEEMQYRAVEAAIHGPYILPETVVHFSKWYELGDTWGRIGTYTFARSW